MGRVEVSYQGAWATVLGRMYGRLNTFDDKAAKVVCRMLGYPTYVFKYMNNKYNYPSLILIFYWLIGTFLDKTWL